LKYQQLLIQSHTIRPQKLWIFYKTHMCNADNTVSPWKKFRLWLFTKTSTATLATAAQTEHTLTDVSLHNIKIQDSNSGSCWAYLKFSILITKSVISRVQLLEQPSLHGKEA
jgi:hypothetical protein